MKPIKPLHKKEKLIGYTMLCPGCDELHAIYTDYDNHPNWSFDGNVDNPTFTPSLRVRFHDGKICHSFIKDGKWQFLNDCHHSLAGQTIPMTFID